MTAGRPVDAEFLDIVDMAVGPDGSLYVVDGDRVRMVSPNGVISTVAGIPGMRTSAAMLLEQSLFHHRSRTARRPARCRSTSSTRRRSP